MIIEYGRINETIPGQGAWDVHFFTNKQKPILIFRCPSCQRQGALNEHKVDKHGNVTPSVVCPYEDCNFHEWIRLDGWKGMPCARYNE